MSFLTRNLFFPALDLANLIALFMIFALCLPWLALRAVTRNQHNKDRIRPFMRRRY